MPAPGILTLEEARATLRRINEASAESEVRESLEGDGERFAYRVNEAFKSVREIAQRLPEAPQFFMTAYALHSVNDTDDFSRAVDGAGISDRDSMRLFGSIDKLLYIKRKCSEPITDETMLLVRGAQFYVSELDTFLSDGFPQEGKEFAVSAKAERLAIEAKIPGLVATYHKEGEQAFDQPEPIELGRRIVPLIIEKPWIAKLEFYLPTQLNEEEQTKILEKTFKENGISLGRFNNLNELGEQKEPGIWLNALRDCSVDLKPMDGSTGVRFTLVVAQIGNAGMPILENACKTLMDVGASTTQAYDLVTASPHSLCYENNPVTKYGEFMSRFGEDPPRTSPDDNYGLPTRIMRQLGMRCLWGCNATNHPFQILRESGQYQRPKKPEYGYRIEQAPAIMSQVINFKEILLTQGYEAAARFALEQNRDVWADLIEGHEAHIDLSGAERARGVVAGGESRSNAGAPTNLPDRSAGK